MPGIISSLTGYQDPTTASRAAKLALFGFVSLARIEPGILHNPLLVLQLRSFQPFKNWLCFFKFLFLILTLSAERRKLNENKLALFFQAGIPTRPAFLLYFGLI
ncbi:MAG: hypothetical protein PVJ86_03480 [Phycisphaerales bacterium]